MNMSKSTFDVIENTGLNTVQNILNAKLASASEVYIAVAFVTQAGLGKIIQPLLQVAATGKHKVCFITGLYQRFTEPQALQTLLDFQKATGGKLSVRLS
jgi:HKD family nuclease